MTVTEPAVARLLEDGRRRRLLLSFVPCERSLKDAAVMNGLPLNLAHYHLRRLIGSGLVETTREQKRAGRPIRFYRSRHDGYFVPDALLRSRPAVGLARDLYTALENARVQTGAGVHFDVDESGRPRMREVVGEGPLPLEIWRRLKLSRNHAEALFTELTSLIHRYDNLGSPKQSSWAIHLAVAQTAE